MIKRNNEKHRFNRVPTCYRGVLVITSFFVSFCAGVLAGEESSLRQVKKVEAPKIAAYRYNADDTDGVAVSVFLEITPLTEKTQNSIFLHANISPQLVEQGWYVELIFQPNEDLRDKKVGFQPAPGEEYKTSKIANFTLDNKNGIHAADVYHVIFLLKQRDPSELDDVSQFIPAARVISGLQNGMYYLEITDRSKR